MTECFLSLLHFQCFLVMTECFLSLLTQHACFKGARADELCSGMKFDTTILVPANVQANHWVLFVVELALGKIQLYDPKAQVGLS